MTWQGPSVVFRVCAAGLHACALISAPQPLFLFIMKDAEHLPQQPAACFQLDMLRRQQYLHRIACFLLNSLVKSRKFRPLAQTGPVVPKAVPHGLTHAVQPGAPLEDFCKEALSMAYHNHPYLVRIFGVVQEDVPAGSMGRTGSAPVIGLVTEIVRGKILSKKLKQ